MKNRSRIIFGIFAAFSYLTGYSQTTDYIKSLDVCINPKGHLSEVPAEKDHPTEWIEDVQARTLTTATYYSNDGQIKTRNSSRPINYLDEKGTLVPIDPTLRQIDENAYYAGSQPYPTSFTTDGTMGVSMNKNKEMLTFGSSYYINNVLIPQNSFKVEGNTAIVENAIPGIHKEITFRENGVKYNYIMMHPLQSQEDVTFSESIRIPEGYTIEFDPSRGKETEYGWSGLVVIKDTRGVIAATFHEPLCFDQNRKYMVASYNLKEIEGAQFIEIVVPEVWLNDSERSYPVIIDPIVTGATAAWTGGQMPSCFMPSYNQDSIYVTIPAGITITEVNVTASFYADPWTSAWMQDGAMFFSTDCANSQTFTISGAAGQAAGTAYLDYFNLFNPLTCCIPESCNSQSFWLSYHLGRNMWGSGCNTTYIRYDPATTSWPYEAVVVGKTAEHTSSEWNVPAVPTCTNDCDIFGIAYVAYGVPPYTFTHPWFPDTIVQGGGVGCSSNATTYSFDLTVPNCPVYCDTLTTTLTVPPPVITDACGNVVPFAQPESVPLKPTPSFNPIYDTLVCSEEPFLLNLGLCIPEASMHWQGNGTEGWSDQIPMELINNSDSISTVNFEAYALYNGCNSDTVIVPVYVHPTPIAAYTTDPSPMISGIDINFYDATVFNVAPGISWTYDFGDGTGASEQNPIHMYDNPGDYPICLAVMNDAGCADTLCELVPVAPAEVQIPNIVTADGDEINDWLEFQYLDFYPDNHLVVTNRWGQVVYEAVNYENDWSPVHLEEGTYFFLLTVTGAEKQYHGFFQLVK